MDLWMLYESSGHERELEQRARRIRCQITDSRCWRRWLSLRLGLALLRISRRLISYGRPAGSALPARSIR